MPLWRYFRDQFHSWSLPDPERWIFFYFAFLANEMDYCCLLKPEFFNTIISSFFNAFCKENKISRFS